MTIGKTGRPDSIIDTQRLVQKQAENTELIVKNRAHHKAAEQAVVDGEDTVTLSAGKAINTQEAAKSERIAEIKRLLELGQYTPPVEKVAESLSAHLDEEIFFEKLLNPAAGTTENEEEQA